MIFTTGRWFVVLGTVAAMLSAQAAAQTAERPSDELVLTINQAPAPIPQGGQLNRSKVADPLWNGTLIGAGVGFAVGFFGLAAYNAKETATGPIWDGEAIGIYTSVGLLGAGIGAGVGALIDALKKTARLPAISHRRRLPITRTPKQGMLIPRSTSPACVPAPTGLRAGAWYSSSHSSCQSEFTFHLDERDRYGAHERHDQTPRQ